MPPAVLIHEGRVIELHARVDVRDHDAVAESPEGLPCLRSPDAVQAPFRALDGNHRRGRHQRRHRDHLVVEDLGDVRPLGDLGKGGPTRRHPDRVHDPERLVLDVVGVEPRAEAGLMDAGGVLQALVDRLAARVPISHAVDARQVRLLLQDDPRGDLVRVVGLAAGLLPPPARAPVRVT